MRKTNYTMNDQHDKERLDWLEQFVAREGELHLHDGSHPRGVGLGFFFGKANRRTLREAIDQARAVAAPPPGQ